MRKALSVLSIIVLGLTAAMADPLTLEQAGNVHEPGVLEAGFGDISYQSDLTEFGDGSKFTANTTVFSLYSRYAFSPVLEGVLSIPYLSISEKTEAGSASATTEDAGLGDLQALVKYNLCDCAWATSAGLGLSVPIGKQSDKLPQSFRNGFNFKPILMATRKYDKFTLDLNLSYNITAEYEDSSAAKTKQDPGDILSAGAGLEYPINKRTSMIGELVYNSLTDAKSNGVTVSGSSGSQMDFIYGIRYDKDSLRTKLAVALSFGDEKYRTYDYKVTAGLTYLWKI